MQSDQQDPTEPNPWPFYATELPLSPDREPVPADKTPLVSRLDAHHPRTRIPRWTDEDFRRIAYVQTVLSQKRFHRYPRYKPSMYKGKLRANAVQAVRQRCMCPPGCGAGYFATRFQALPWTDFLTLTASSSDLFNEYWAEWFPLFQEICAKYDQAIWIYSVAGTIPQPHVIGTVGGHARYSVPPPLRALGLHVHMILGGLPRSVIRRLVKAWPGQQRSKHSAWAKPVTHAWGALHYLADQPRQVVKGDGTVGPDTWAHRSEKSKCACGLLLPPVLGPDVEFYAQTIHDQLNSIRARTAAQAKARKRRRAS